jgi:ribosomal protein L4
LDFSKKRLNIEELNRRGKKSTTKYVLWHQGITPKLVRRRATSTRSPRIRGGLAAVELNS